MAEGCTHITDIRFARPVTRGPDTVCVDCVREGTEWVHLRACAACGDVRCCDSSPRRHASAHAESGAHPIAWSIEPGETWGWCYVDEFGFEGSRD